MIDIKLDDEGDLVISNGDLVLIGGAEACAQRIRIRALTIKGELFSDRDAGMPFFDMDTATTGDVLAWYRQMVLTTDEVASINALDYTFDPATREMTITGEAVHDSGAPIPLGETFKIGGLS